MTHLKRMLVMLLLVLNLTLFSCTNINRDIPHTSNDFPQEFVDSFLTDYYLYDPQLHYVSINNYEIKYKYEYLVNPSAPTTVFISQINNVDKEQFVAVTHFESIPALEGDSEPYVYQRKDAPIPMRDYTIKSVSVVGCQKEPRQFVGSPDFETLQNQALNYFDVFLNNEQTKIIAEYTAEDYPDIIDSLRNGYNNTSSDGGHTGYLYTCDEGDTRGETYVYYYLLFMFKETDGLVWFAPISVDNITGENLYYEYSYYEKAPDITDNEGNRYLHYEKIRVLAPISEDVETAIRNLLGKN